MKTPLCLRSGLGLCVLLLLLSAPAWACLAPEPGAAPQLTIPLTKPSSQEQDDYYIGLLKLILAVTEKEDGPCNLIQVEQAQTRSRSAAQMHHRQGVDLFWGTASTEREALLRSIRVPLLKGLMSHKLLLIEAGHQHRFSQVQTLEDLQQLRAGQGSDWPDVAILRANGLEVITSVNYEALFRMLAAGRFDFFPRGANQALSELRYNAAIPLVLEQELVLVYSAPVYFYVNQANNALAERIEKGLRRLQTDGSFDRYFYSHPMIVETLSKTHLQNRRPIYLENHLLPPGLELEQPMPFWPGPLGSGRLLREE